MLANDAKGRQVMSTATASKVAKVAGFIVDTPAARIVALRLSKVEGDGDTLHWEDIKGFGQDAVTVPSEDVLKDASGRAAELSDKTYDVLGKRVLDDQGNELGKVRDLEFDPSTGALTALVLADGTVSGSRLLDCGSYAVIVRAETVSPESAQR